jgi:hypothetical protein
MIAAKTGEDIVTTTGIVRGMPAKTVATALRAYSHIIKPIVGQKSHSTNGATNKKENK